MLTVTNNSDCGISDRYNGVNYSFPVGSTVAVPDEVVKHIFGIGEGDKTPFLVRLGWMRTSADEAEAMSRLGNFSFGVVTENEFDPGQAPTLAEVMSDEDGDEGAVEAAKEVLPAPLPAIETKPKTVATERARTWTEKK